MKSKRGYLLIEVILALSIFALFAGSVTQMFLLGLKFYNDSTDGPNEATISMVLINRIKKEHVGSGATGTSIELPFQPLPDSGTDEEGWRLQIESAQEIPSITPKNGAKFYALKVKIGKIPTSSTESSPLLNEKTYEIFRCIST
jgi:hypothetical protein